MTRSMIELERLILLAEETGTGTSASSSAILCRTSFQPGRLEPHRGRLSGPPEAPHGIPQSQV
jgi:hypothetical protein